MTDYIDPAWRPVLEHNGLADFAAWWQLEAGWFEAPNQRRNGWSGVSRVSLSLPDGQVTGVFLKRQENHNTFSWRHPWRGIPTFVREFRHLMHYRACQVPTLDPVYFASRVVDGQSRAILVTRELAGFMPLDVWSTAEPRSRNQRHACLMAVAVLLRKLHRHHVQHNCCFPKHLFARASEDGTVEVRIIDLEKSRWRPLALLCALRDLDTLNRHALGWSRTDRLRFLRIYLDIPRLTFYAKWLWRRLVLRQDKKRRGRLVQ
jgi:hypothetical protein